MKVDPPGARIGWRSLSVLMMVALVICFVAQQVIVVPKSYSAYLFLSGYGMKSGHLWELLTCQLFQSPRGLFWGIGHLALNLAGLWFLGRRLEEHLDGIRFLLLYLGAGLAGALAQGAAAVTGYLLPDALGPIADFLIARYGESVGASCGLCGVLAVYCLWKREARISLLGILPVKIGRLLWVALLVLATLIVIPSDPSLAHIGHFVALLTGMAFFRLWFRTAFCAAHNAAHSSAC